MSADHRAQNDGYTPGAGLPLGVPTGSGDDALSSQVSAEFGAYREPNTSDAPLPEVPARSRIGHRMLAHLDQSLSDRDRDILRLIAEHRFLTTHQLQAFRFDDHQSDASASRVARRVLARLDRDGLLEPLDRRVGGYRARSTATIWRLTAAGGRLVYGDDKRRRPGKPTERFLKHCLAIADVHVLLRQHRRIEAIEDVQVAVEPASWRTYQGPGGERRWLQPDLYAEITTSDFLDRHFIEVDLGSESLPTLLKKCAQYEDYRRSGVEQSRFGSFPLVVWLFLDDRRGHKLEAAVRRSSKLTAAMYRYATPGTLTEVLAGGAS